MGVYRDFELACAWDNSNQRFRSTRVSRTASGNSQPYENGPIGKGAFAAGGSPAFANLCRYGESNRPGFAR